MGSISAFLVDGFVLDGFVGGAWKIESFKPLSKKDLADPAEEAKGFVRFIGEEAGAFEVRFVGGREWRLPG